MLHHHGTPNDPMKQILIIDISMKVYMVNLYGAISIQARQAKRCRVVAQGRVHGSQPGRSARLGRGGGLCVLELHKLVLPIPARKLKSRP
eukprot:scaffold2404_cov398-Prasinococcus_capsulatus_cf.AAC.51